MSSYLGFVGSLVLQIFNIALPYGIAFGSLVVAVFGLPYLAKVIKKLF